MSALAQALLDVGYAVSGSDRFLDSGDTTDTLEQLRRRGRHVSQNGEGVAGAGRLVVKHSWKRQRRSGCHNPPRLG